MASESSCNIHSFTLILLVMSLIKVLSQEQSFKGFFNDSNTFAVFLILGLLTLIISSMKYHKFNFFVMFVMMSGILVKSRLL